MYTVEYINCKVCGKDAPRFLGTRGNREYSGASSLGDSRGHMVTNVVRCKNCGFVYTNPLIVTEINTYNDPGDYFSSCNMEPEILFSFILDLIEKSTTRGKILDIGCGKGEFLSIAKKRGWEAYGLEPSANFARFASEEYGLNINSNPLEKAKDPDSCFDAVVLNMVLEHISNPREFLAEVKRILRKGGLLFIEVPNMDSLMLKAANLYFRAKGKDWSPLLSPLHYPFHCYGYNISSLRYLLSTQDFCIEKALVRDSSLRGFRPDSGGAPFEKFIRNVITKLAGLIGKGDVLMVIAKREAR